MCEDNNGKGRPIAYFWVKNEQERTLSSAFQFFTKYHKNIMDRTKVIIIDKDFTEMKILENLFPKASVFVMHA